MSYDFYLCSTLKEELYMKNPHSLEELKQILGMKFPIFPYSKFNAFLESYSHNVKHAQKQGVVTLRRFYKIRQVKL